MSTEVAHPHSESQFESSPPPAPNSPPTPDSIDKELDWLIEKEEKERAHDRSGSPEDRHVKSPENHSSPEPTSPRDDDDEKKKMYHNADTHFPREKTPSPQGSPSRSPENSPRNTTDDSKQDGDDLELSDDQKQALAELNNMKLDLGYTEEDPPEYDVAERVRQLNEELANDPEPDEDRERSIKFKENLVDLVAPPPPDDSEDEQGDRQQSPGPGNSEEDTPRSSEGQQSPRRTDSDDGSPRSTDNEDDAIRKVHDSQSEQDDEKVLVERNGKFELLSASELTAEEREMYGVSEPTESSKSKQKKDRDPRPPAGPRPNTANGGSQRNKSSAEPQRSQSAQGQTYNEWNEDFNYQSPYALTPEQKKEMAKKHREEQKQKNEDEGKKQREKDKQKDESEEAFSAWLRKKRESQSQRRKDDGNRKKKEGDEEEENHDPDGAFDSWCKAKKDQSKKDKDVDKRKTDMYDEGWYVRPRNECEKAYKEWLKKKNEESRKHKTDDKQRARLHKLLASRSRKSQQLARAIKQAQAFRYVDYYGYSSGTSSDVQVTAAVAKPQPCS